MAKWITTKRIGMFLEIDGQASIQVLMVSFRLTPLSNFLKPMLMIPMAMTICYTV